MWHHGDADTPQFFISRYAANERQEKYIYRAVESIRLIYPDARITVVDDYSPAEYSYAPDGPLTRVVSNPYPRSGEMGTLRAAWSSVDSEDSAVVTMHDGMVLRSPIGLEEDEEMKFLWHFDRYFAMHLPETLRLLSHLAMPTNDLFCVTHGFTTGFNKTWRGCFGMSLIARKRALDRLHQGSRIFGHEFMSAVNTRSSRQGAERVVGLLAHAFAKGAGGGMIPSACGCIFDHPSPWSTHTADMSLGELLAVKYDKPFLKTWSGR